MLSVFDRKIFYGLALLYQIISYFLLTNYLYWYKPEHTVGYKSYHSVVRNELGSFFLNAKFLGNLFQVQHYKMRLEYRAFTYKGF